MYLTVPETIRRFVDGWGANLDKRKKTLIPWLVAGLLFCQGKKTYGGLARTLILEPRNRASVSKLFQRSPFRSRDMYQQAVQWLTTQLAPPQPELWVLVIDGVHIQRGGNTQVQNAIKYKEKQKAQGRTTKSHAFIQGLLITAAGVRLPQARRTYYTKRYCRKHGRTYISMTRLAELIMEKAVVPPHVSLVVLADEFFEGQRLHAACERLHYRYICPLNKSRCLADEQGQRLPINVTQYSLSLHLRQLKTVAFTPGREQTVLLRRRTGQDHKIRRYCATSVSQNVSSLGNVMVTYSWKNITRRRKLAKCKILVTNALDWDTADIIEYYELRWQIEIFFRELKTYLGLEDFQGTRFEDYERFYDMVLLAYLFLEWYRLTEILATVPKAANAKSAYRILPLIHKVQQAALNENYLWLQKKFTCHRTAMNILKKINLAFAA